MNELLKEFISHILTEESAASAEARRLKLKYVGYNLWGPEKGKPATHKKDTNTGKLIPVAGDAPKSPGSGKKSGSDQPPRTRPQGKRTADTPGVTNQKQTMKSTGKPTVSTVVDDLLARVTGVRNTRKRQNLTTLANALKSGEPKKISDVVKKLRLVLGSTGVLKARNEPLQDITGGDAKLSQRVYDAIVKAGVGIESLVRIAQDKLPSEEPTEDVSSAAEVFKPSTMFSDRPEVSVSVGPTSVKIGESVYSMLNTFEPMSERRNSLLVERMRLREIRNNNPDFSEEEVERKADDVNGILCTHNSRVRFLREVVESGAKFRDLGNGPAAVKLVSERLSRTLKSVATSSEQKKLQSALDVMARAKSVEEFDNGWKEMRTTLENSNLPDGSIPLICEHLAAMRNAINGQSIMLPESDSFKLGDIIAYSPGGVTSSDVREIVKGILMIQVGIDINSVKREAGAASAVGSRIPTTTFAGEGVEDSLAILGRGPTKTDPGAMGEIFRAQNSAELKKVKEKIIGTVMGRIKDVRSYYKIPDSMSDEQVLEGLMTGNVPTYDKKGNFVKFGSKSTQFNRKNNGKGISPLNREQLRLYSLSGYAFEAIYNANATGQAFSNTTFKPNKIMVSDGIAIMGRTRFQFYKKMRFRSDGVLRDDGIAAKIEPVPRSRMRTIV